NKSPEERLIELIAKSVAPASWAWEDGKGTIDYFPVSQALVVNQTADIHEQIAELLETLRHFKSKNVGCTEKRACMLGCGMPCGKVAGSEVQVTGLLKACRLALTCGDHSKACELARQAQALDAARVAADPVAYKMHLLALRRDA